MLCPQCGFKMGVTERICARCCCFLETGVCVDVQPPRGSRPNPFRTVSGGCVRTLSLRKRELRVLRFRYAFANLIPGLGHMLNGRVAQGAGYGLSWLLLAFIAFHIKGAWGQVILAIAGIVHAHAIYAMVPRAHEQSEGADYARFGITMVGLLVVVYWPVSEYLGWIDPITIQTNTHDWVLAHVVFLLFMCFAAVALFYTMRTIFGFAARVLDDILHAKKRQ